MATSLLGGGAAPRRRRRSLPPEWLLPVADSWADVDYDVIVVGAGPTGLACAHSAVLVRVVVSSRNRSACAQNGATCLVVDARPGVSEKDSKCTGIRPRSVQVLHQTGALAELGGEAALTPVCDLPVYACTAEAGPVSLLYSLRAAAPRAGALGTPPPRERIAFSAEQWRCERALLASLERRPGAVVRRDVRLLGLHCCERGVTVRVAAAGAAEAEAVRCGPDEARPRPGCDTLRCKYLVACDGVGGGVRAALGVGRTGAPYEELFLIADVQLEGFSFDPHSRPTFLHAERGRAAERFVTRDLHIAPLSGGKARLFFVVDAAAPRRDLVAAFRALSCDGGDGEAVAWMQAALAGYGLGGLRIAACHRISRYGVWLGCADDAAGPGREGAAERRVFLAGDAAHSHSPRACRAAPPARAHAPQTAGRAPTRGCRTAGRWAGAWRWRRMRPRPPPQRCCTATARSGGPCGRRWWRWRTR